MVSDSFISAAYNEFDRFSRNLMPWIGDKPDQRNNLKNRKGAGGTPVLYVCYRYVLNAFVAVIIWHGSGNGHEIPEDISGHIRNKIAWSDFVADMASMWDSNDHARFDCARPAKIKGHPVLDRLHHASEQVPKAARNFSDDVGNYVA